MQGAPLLDEDHRPLCTVDSSYVERSTTACRPAESTCVSVESRGLELEDAVEVGLFLITERQRSAMKRIPFDDLLISHRAICFITVCKNRRPLCYGNHTYP